MNALEYLFETLPLVERMGVFPSSGDILQALPNADACLTRLRERYAAQALEIDERHGLRMVFEQWRFWVHRVQGEAAVVLRVDSRGDVGVLGDKTQELLSRLRSFTADQ
ncbi:MAG: mannose-1-phosphate guanylyltransferase [Pseudomonas sp.]|uniref:mannose-1-phosphate guanylyltransferase n=1 Tax=Pseudomonas abieticivorans TaxID=2931382 RepID=UPI0020BE245C|nr:mannose-1-phosphate guanylyltransferase [Pseudomonas sp. PIA16]MDE1165589.1 mannose-1-phosphate guanylyltransferase [Pseudomonas sp.]